MEAEDARHDVPYVPAPPCTEKFVAPRKPCTAGPVHACSNPRETHTTLCLCRCGFTWDITGHPVTQQKLPN